MVEKKKVTKEFIKLPYSTLEQHLKRTTLVTDVEIGNALGYKGSAISHWRKVGECPKVAVIAAECLVRRMGPDAAKVVLPQAQIFVVRAGSKETSAYLELMFEQTKDCKLLFKGAAT